MRLALADMSFVSDLSVDKGSESLLDRMCAHNPPRIHKARDHDRTRRNGSRIRSYNTLRPSILHTLVNVLFSSALSSHSLSTACTLLCYFFAFMTDRCNTFSIPFELFLHPHKFRLFPIQCKLGFEQCSKTSRQIYR